MWEWCLGRREVTTQTGQDDIPEVSGIASKGGDLIDKGYGAYGSVMPCGLPAGLGTIPGAAVGGVNRTCSVIRCGVGVVPRKGTFIRIC